MGNDNLQRYEFAYKDVVLGTKKYNERIVKINTAIYRDIAQIGHRSGITHKAGMGFVYKNGKSILRLNGEYMVHRLEDLFYSSNIDALD